MIIGVGIAIAIGIEGVCVATFHLETRYQYRPRWAILGILRGWTLDQRAGRHHQTILVGIEVFPRAESDPRKGDGQVFLAGTALAAFERMGVQSPDADGKFGDGGGIPDTAIYHDTLPAVLAGHSRQDVSHQGTFERTAPVDHQDGVRDGFFKLTAYQDIVLENLDGVYPTAELPAAPKSLKFRSGNLVWT